jgi:dolichol-phosphate mannosyltransferase
MIAWLFRKRFFKFGTVGASGVVVNLVLLTVCQEFIFSAVETPVIRLNLSLAVAIFFSTANNFYWNRYWTWSDRAHRPDKHLVLHFGQYALACWVGTGLQILLTNLFSLYFHYLVANAAAIVIASLFNFMANNFWTFRSHKPVDEIALPIIPEPDTDGEPGAKPSAKPVPSAHEHS